MPIYPEDLYQLKGADIGSQHLNLISQQATDSQLATSATALIAIPENEIWLLNNACVVAVAGAAQITTGITLFIRRGTQNIINLVRIPNLTNQSEAFDRQFAGIPIRGSVSLGAFASFDAGAAANAVTLHVQAVSIPRGNFVQT